jgi:hypothetical protein
MKHNSLSLFTPNFQVCQLHNHLCIHSRVLWVGYWWYLWCTWCHSHKRLFRICFWAPAKWANQLATQPPPPCRGCLWKELGPHQRQPL